MKDLTKGKPSTLILSFALPVFLGNLLQLTYSLADTRIVGSFLKEDALAAVGATSPLSGLIIGFLMGFANGFAIVTAQKFGAGNREEVRKSFALSLVMGSVISLILTVLGLLVSASDPEVPECSGSFDGNCQAVYLYYYRRYAGNVSL